MDLLVWLDNGDSRRYMIIDVKKSIVKKGIACPGSRVLCAVLVEKDIWLGTEVMRCKVFYELSYDISSEINCCLENAKTCLLFLAECVNYFVKIVETCNIYVMVL